MAVCKPSFTGHHDGDHVNNEAINISNLDYIEQLYTNYKTNPASVDLEWKRFFEGVDFAQGGTLGVSDKELSVLTLIQTYRSQGFNEASLDPLGLKKNTAPELELKYFGLSDKDLDTKFQIGSLVGKTNAPLREIIAHLRKLYCGTMTIQVSDTTPETEKWFIREFENSNFKLSTDEKKAALQALSRAEALEKFLHTRYVGQKRFSVEGGDALLPMMDLLVQRGSKLQLKEVVVGMAHRGRINMLVNFMGKPLDLVFGDLNGPLELEQPLDDFDGDVKYHLGYKTEKETANGKVKAVLAYNPSHLETVNGVTLGMARAVQKLSGDKNRKQVIPVLIHGDAAFAGQGIVFEILQMSNVDAYTVGGTIHIVIDNQVGFTTKPENARSTRFPTEVAKSINAPVIHVSGDDIESCLRAMDLALRYRQEFGRDVVLDIVCYRRYGHNEGDEPAYTQPLMYDVIKTHATAREIYAQVLIKEGCVDQKFAEELSSQRMDELQSIYEETKKSSPKLKNFKFEGPWKGLRKSRPEDFEKPANTKFDLNKLKDIGVKAATVPADFTPHPKLLKLLETRKNMGLGKELIDWGMAELLAYGSLLSEGHSVRLTGQDVVRGTFTHRHAAFYDIVTGLPYFPLADVNPAAMLAIQNSILSEYGVMAYEYGFSTEDPNQLTIWEAQFGDFVNGAQIVVDQYLAAGEAKWQLMSGLVLLLPHGYEGQGPEHSSARLERFLQSCAQYNMQVCNFTTPAQIYHALRRQVRREFRKPLVVMSPKSLLRHAKAVSTIEELATGQFHEVIVDTIDRANVDTVIFVSGKLYYDLADEREKNKKTNVALVRLEQIYPFPAKQVTDVLKSYPKLKNLIWAQEEPRNMGAFQNVYFRFMEVIINESIKVNMKYVGRPEKASPATGSNYRHKTEQAEIVANCFKV